tara:strand:+ start:105 stop:710 length:606 start_codon:yes stop_codon:yes gene_type:complete
MTFLPEAYTKITSVAEFQHSIVAGGFVRDSVMGGPIKDLDVFIPCNDQADFMRKIQVLRDAGVIQISDEPLTDQYDFNIEFVGKFDAKDGDLDIDLCGVRHYGCANSFPSKVLDTFHYDIDQGYSTGAYPIVTTNQQRDINSRTATLARIGHPNTILSSARKFDRLKEKYPDLTFNCALRIESRYEGGGIFGQWAEAIPYN